MPRPRTGQVLKIGGRFYARVRLGTKRPTFELRSCDDESAAQARAAVLSELGGKLCAAGQEDIASAILTNAAAAGDERTLADVCAVAERVCSGELVRKVERAEGLTYRRLSEMWTSGELHRRYPDHVKGFV